MSSNNQALASSVARSETVCKYQLDQKEVRQDGSVRYNALMPAKDGMRSVFRISGLTEQDIWEIGLAKVALKRSLPLLGRFDLLAGLVYDHNLHFVPDTDLTSRHADIAGWPAEKEKQISIAQSLAAEAQVRAKPKP